MVVLERRGSLPEVDVDEKIPPTVEEVAHRFGLASAFEAVFNLALTTFLGLRTRQLLRFVLSAPKDEACSRNRRVELVDAVGS